jgi:hypothetical protein
MRECRSEGVELTMEEAQRLQALPNAAHELELHLLCELEDGHAGPHYALAQSDDRGGDDITNWWLCWSSEVREWANNPTCFVENVDASEFCLLPVGHEGAHHWT